ncbi:hypothetical protein [Wolbachia endosymbiont of Bemisia tabaci]|uniref:hypothetical protein n=1 Tax=Wolbachia endosymbiont of Bemisia tabaci TaxID=215173 RepID=UPI001FED1F4C|nr:hypothetical protein [Wolbachia endosymbiont of Bemisia tabaci]
MTSITGTKFFLKRSKGKKGAKMEDFFWDFWPTVDEEVRKEREEEKSKKLEQELLTLKKRELHKAGTRTINTKKKRAT